MPRAKGFNLVLLFCYSWRARDKIEENDFEFWLQNSVQTPARVGFVRVGGAVYRSLELHPGGKVPGS